MDLNWREQYVGILELVHEGITFWFIDNEYYFNGFTPYGDTKWDIEKFAFFSKASLSACRFLISARTSFTAMTGRLGLYRCTLIISGTAMSSSVVSKR